MLDFCKSKFSANVIEKCFENKENISKNYLIKSLLNFNSEQIIDILLDNYGIYVIQKALKFSDIKDKNKLIELILERKKELSNINLNDYKYKIILKVINSHKELSEIFLNINNKKSGENFQDNAYYTKEENNMEYNSFNNNNYNNKKGKNKRGKKFHKGYNNNNNNYY